MQQRLKLEPTKPAPKRFCGVKGRSGPPKGSLNALKNGKHLANRLVVGELPRELLSVKREARCYRRQLEAEVLAVHREIDVSRAHSIDTASAATIHAGICRWLLRRKIGEMSTGDILACSRELVRAKQARDSAVERLRLKAKNDPWAINVTATEEDTNGDS